MVAYIVVVVVETLVASYGSFHHDVDLVAFADCSRRHRRHHGDLRHHSCDVILHGHQALANRPRSYPDPPRLDKIRRTVGFGVVLGRMTMVVGILVVHTHTSLADVAARPAVAGDNVASDDFDF